MTTSESDSMTPGRDFRRHWPRLGHRIWLDTPSIAPAADVVAAALRQAIDRWQCGEDVIPRWEGDIAACRTLLPISSVSRARR